MKNVLYLSAWHRERYNIGDNVYLQGSISLLTEAIGEHFILECNLEQFVEDINNVEKILGLDLDLIVTTGAPYLYSNFQVAWQYEFLKRLNVGYPDVPKIALGLGGCSGLSNNYFNNRIALDAAKEIFGQFDLIVAREPLTAQFLELAGVSCKILLDSAVFFPIQDYIKELDLKNTQEKPVFCYFDYRAGISRGDITEFEAQQIDNMYKEIYEKYNPITYCVNEAEVEPAKKLGIEAKWLWHFEDILPLLAQATFLISARVHQATLAKLLDKNSYVIPFDIRYLCSTAIGVQPVFPYQQLEFKAGICNIFYKDLINKTRVIIINEIRKVMTNGTC